MEQTATHDELVKFAERKLLRPIGDLNSWDLMGKGLTVAEKTGLMDWILDGGMLMLMAFKKHAKPVRFEVINKVQKEADPITELPIAFWEAWYELEQQNAMDRCLSIQNGRISAS